MNFDNSGNFKCITVSFKAFIDRKGLTQATSFISVWTWAAAFALLVWVCRLLVQKHFQESVLVQLCMANYKNSSGKYENSDIIFSLSWLHIRIVM